MGRFFQHATVEDIVRNFVRPDNASYNATFTYPEGGAIQYVNALARGETDRAGRAPVSVDLSKKCDKQAADPLKLIPRRLSWSSCA
jgi:hypothetical protein